MEMTEKRYTITLGLNNEFKEIIDHCRQDRYISVFEFLKQVEEQDKAFKKLKTENKELKKEIELLKMEIAELRESEKDNYNIERFSWEYSHYDSTGEIYDWKRKECLITDYLQKYEIEEWCQELNKIVNENEQLKKENKELRSDRDSYHKNIVSGINDYIKDHTIKVDKLPVYGNDKLIYQLPNKLQYLYFRKKWECIGEVEKELEE